MRVVTHSVVETLALGRTIGGVLEAGDVVLLAGELGAGKTQLAKGIATGLEVSEPVVSPTFALAREYEGRIRMVHVDVYRLDRVQEFIDLGLDEAGGDVVTVVEWGDVVGAYLPAERLEVRLEVVGTEPEAETERIVTMNLCGSTWRARSAALASAFHEVP